MVKLSSLGIKHSEEKGNWSEDSTKGPSDAEMQCARATVG
jgi:hypothetical protein